MRHLANLRKSVELFSLLFGTEFSRNERTALLPRPQLITEPHQNASLRLGYVGGAILCRMLG
ncbi:hypothetical protein JMJ77_0004357 [Colletotrichum scovillei]|uniref:Uncharacterized protein n=1 Tax=Colletotrichum scovillei TaxID=1209932 RepID=A0A9P7R0B0_9PEZI|nr:hypothetical protein JMJ77_0004357 [Colletotrichum scovillei]KAG7049635.1 hypothetical protein JMJ78_0013614 [Colletotrichum scovillei]KAG7064351.1 hypothetical protein JMJ76_0007396 [Colletotrichum scovillei]